EMNCVLADSGLIDVLFEIGAHILSRILQPPANSRIVVVRTCVYDEVRCKIMGYVIRRSHVVSKGKLQNLHSRKIELIAQGKYPRVHFSQVFRHQCQLSHLLLKRVKDIGTRTFSRLAIDSGLLTGGHFPERNKSAEMIESDHVEQVKV